MIGWKGFFDVKVSADNEAIIGSIQNLNGVLQAAGILVAHIIGFIGLAIIVFRRKDILT